MEIEELMTKLNKREHISVLGTKEQIDETAVTYGWTYSIKPLCEQDAMILAAVDFNTRQIFCLIGTDWQFWPIRESIINCGRYGKVLDLDSRKLEDLFFPEYESAKLNANARVQAENISHYCDMLEAGFGFSREKLKDMVAFCELNELYDKAHRIQTELDNHKG